MGPRWIESSSPMKYSCPLVPPKLIKPPAAATNSQEVKRDGGQRGMLEDHTGMQPAKPRLWDTFQTNDRTLRTDRQQEAMDCGLRD